MNETPSQANVLIDLVPKNNNNDNNNCHRSPSHPPYTSVGVATSILCKLNPSNDQSPSLSSASLLSVDDDDDDDDVDDDEFTDQSDHRIVSPKSRENIINKSPLGDNQSSHLLTERREPDGCRAASSLSDSPTPPSSVFSSLSNSSSNSPGDRSTVAPPYSELLRYRSQEFYVKLNPGQSTSDASSSTASNNTQVFAGTSTQPRKHLTTSNFCGRELSLNDLSQIESQLYVNCRLESSPGAVSAASAGHPRHGHNHTHHQQTQQHSATSERDRYFPQHPHYRNHLYNSGARSLSLVRSNSSLSLSYHQQHQHQHQHLHRRFNRLAHLQPASAFVGGAAQNTNQQSQSHSLFTEHPRRHLFGPSLFQPSPSLTLSTHNLFTTDSGYSSAYSGTLDSRVSRVSVDSPGSISRVPRNQRTAATTLNTSSTNGESADHVGAVNTARSNLVINCDNSNNHDSAMNGVASGTNTGPASSSNAKCSNPGTVTASPLRSGYSNTPSRAPLTRSSSSGVSDSSMAVQPSGGSYYCQSSGYGTVVKGTGTSLRPAASLVTVLAADGNQIQAYYQPPTNVASMSQYAQPIYGTTGANQNAIYGKLGQSTGGGSSGSSGGGAVNYGLPQRFPTTNLSGAGSAGSKLTGTGSPVKLAHKPVVVNSGPNVAALANSFHLQSSPSREIKSRSDTLRAQGVFATSGGAPTNSATTTGAAGNALNSSVAANIVGGGMMLDKKNKLFGSVSSIDLQCLKESQKVSVIERKTSRAGRLTKNATVTSATSAGMLAAAAGAANADNVSTSGNISSSNSGGGAANSFFRLFTSSSSRNNKMIPFAFSNNSANSVSSNESGASNHTLTSVNGADTRNVKSASFDLPVSSGSNTVAPSTAHDGIVPANEILFRKYFTFYDLMSATNFRRLFDCGSNGSTNTETALENQQTESRFQKTSTTFESNTMSSTSSYSSCSSSISSVSHHKNIFNAVSGANKSSPQWNAGDSKEVGNDLLAPSQNYLNEVGIEKQYSIELRWNNGSKEEIPPTMIHQQEHNDDESIYDSIEMTNGQANQAPKDLHHLHPPTLSKRINIFSDASPFAAYCQHSVMSDLYGSDSQNAPKKVAPLAATDFSDLDDGFESLSSNSTYPNPANGLSNTSSEASAGTKCPFSGVASNLLEIDHGSNYYRTHFRDFEHQNWLQIHEKYGPIVVSLRKERLKSSNSSSSSSSSSANSQNSIRWRAIVRTTSLIPLRGTVCALPDICNMNTNSGSSCSLDSKSKSADNFNVNSAKDVLSLVMPKTVNINNFRLSASTAVSHLLKLDELSQNTEYKIGVLYAYGKQHSEEEFYNNILEYAPQSKSQFYDFMNLVSSRVRLKNFKGYKAGLDVHKDTTGEYSWTSRFSHVDIMFHVCTELPYTETNRQQLSRKRHIGNDIVTIIFLDEDFVGEPFTPVLIRSKFQQVFIIVKPVNGGQYYRVAVARHKLVPLFGPPLKAYYSRNEIKDLILTKIINAENACHSVNKFAEMAKRTRNEYLVDLCNKHLTNQTTSHFDNSSSSINSLHSIKKLFGASSNGSSSGSMDASKKSKLGSNHELSMAAEASMNAARQQASLVPPFSRSHVLNGVKDAPTLLGGVLFTERCMGSATPSKLYVHDFSTSRDIEASLLLSNEAIMVINAANSQVIWAAPVTSIIGWTDSSGVFASSPTTLPEKFSQINGGGGHTSSRLTGVRAKSMDSESSSSNTGLNSNSACRELRLYYHQGECIQIMQRPVMGAHHTIEQIHAPVISGKSKQAAPVSNARNDDPFLQLVRLLELVTRKSELREIVIKRKTSPIHKPTYANSTGAPSKALPFEPPGRSGGQFGYSMDISTGIIEDVFDQTLSGFQLTNGCKVLEVAKISFAVMSPDELQDLLNASVIISLTFTEFDFFRYQPRCNCQWPQAMHLQQKLKNQMTPPGEYENVGTSGKKNSGNCPGVKSINITHAHTQENGAGGDGSTSGGRMSKHNALVSMSSTSSTSSYYSTAPGSSNPATPPQSNYHQPSLYNAKSTSNLAQFSVGCQNNRQDSPTKASAMSSSVHNSPAHSGTLSRAKSTTISTSSTGSSNFKDNLIRLITMDDCSPSLSNPSSPSINGDSPAYHDQFNVNDHKIKSASNNYSMSNYSVSNNANPQTNSLRSTSSSQNQKPYVVDFDQQSPYSSYPSSRYSTASSAQYSSLGRNGATNFSAAVPNTTQIQLNQTNNSNNTASIKSAQSSGNILNASQKDSCFVLTAQPVRIDSASLAHQQQQQQQQQQHHHHQQNLMTASLDSSMFHSIMSGASGTTSETIGDIVWPSMASETPPSSLMSSSAIRNTVSNNEIIVTGAELTETPAGQAAQHLTDEVRKLSLEKDVLNDTILKLREENQRLHIESQNTSHQLRKLTEWFFVSGNSSPVSNSSSTTNSATQSTSGNNSSNATTINIQQNNSNCNNSNNSNASNAQQKPT